jgi:hypothetical protein
MGRPRPAWLQSSAKVGRCTAKKTGKVRLDARDATAPVGFRLTSKPRKGNEKERVVLVDAGARSVVTLRKQRSGAAVKVSVGGKVLARCRLSC